MKIQNISSVILSLFLFNATLGCSSPEKLKEEYGDLLREKLNFTKRTMPAEYSVVTSNDNKTVTFVIIKKLSEQLDWDDEYSTVLVYTNGKRETLPERSLKRQSTVESKPAPIADGAAKLAIGSKLLIGKLIDGTVKFSISEMNLDSVAWPTIARLKVDDSEIDVAGELFNISQARKTEAQVVAARKSEEKAAQLEARENAANGDDPPNRTPYTDMFPKGSCLESQQWNFTMFQRLSEKLYEIGVRDGVRYLLRTKKARYSTPGYLVGISVKHTGSRAMTLNNGFARTYEVFTECAVHHEWSRRKVNPPDMAVPYFVE